MRLFEINNAILECIDLETGEITDIEKLEQLQMDRHDKLRNIAFLYLNSMSDITELKEQEKKFADRRKRAESTAAWAKETLLRELNGEKMKETEFTISYRKSESVEIQDEGLLPMDYLIEQPAKIDKAGIKEALKSGKEVAGAVLVEKQNIQIK